jgi:hypothetical protein
MKVPNISGNFARATGTLHIDLNRQEGKATQVYTMSLDQLEPM